ncbi:hypothetical protein F4861DRAFT_164509 [Xylaria intraflava]|nr:hypothetical protein F4861DRAFT_164509 [Xylaria intraflava]
MAFEIQKLQRRSDQWALFILVLILVPLTSIAIILRFVATRRAHRKLGLEDLLALLGFVFSVEYGVASIFALVIVNGRSVEEILATAPTDFAAQRKWVFAGLLGFYFQQSFTRLSITALYYRLFGTVRVYARWIIFWAVVQTAFLVFMVLFQIFQCIPVDKFWWQEKPGRCIDEGVFVITLDIPNALLDFALVAQSLVMVRPLQVASSVKWNLRFLFALGGLAGLVEIAKISITYKATDPIFAFSTLGLLAFVQQTVGIICCCAPVYRTLFSKNPFWRRVARHERRPNKHDGSSGQSLKPHVDTPKTPVTRKKGLDNLSSDDTTSLTWPTARVVESHAMSDFARDGWRYNELVEQPGTIQVTRSVNII